MYKLVEIVKGLFIMFMVQTAKKGQLYILVKTKNGKKFLEKNMTDVGAKINGTVFINQVSSASVDIICNDQ